MPREPKYSATKIPDAILYGHPLETTMRPKLARTLLAFSLSITLAGATAPLHPLDSLTTAEYWTAYDVLQQAGHAAPDSFFASVLLREPTKDLVLAWKEGSPVPREADVVMLQNGKTFEARVDLAARKLLSWQEMKVASRPSFRVKYLDPTQ